jgi:ABC-type sugar transport system substrate-binding protein
VKKIKNVKRILAIVVISLFVVSLLGGCKSTTKTTSSTSSSSTANNRASEKGLLDINGKQIYVIYLSNETMSTWQSVNNLFLQSLVRSAGGKCDVYSADSDPVKQAQQFQDAIVKKPDIIVTKPVDSAAVVSSIDAVNTAGIPVMSIDVQPDGGKELTHIETSQEDLGALDAKYIGETFKKEGKRAEVLVINGQEVASNSQQRRNGFMDEVTREGNIDILAEVGANWDNTQSLNDTLDLIARYPQFNALHSQSDAMMQGILQAMKQKNVLFPVGNSKHIVVTSIDGAPNGLQGIRDGYIDHISEHNSALHADIACKVIIDYFHGYIIPNPITFPCYEITKADVNDSIRWGNLDVKKVDTWPVMNETQYPMQTPPANGSSST